MKNLPSEPFNHAEQSDQELISRSNELQELLKIPHSEPRKSELEHELACIAFECGQRVLQAEISPDSPLSSNKELQKI